MAFQTQRVAGISQKLRPAPAMWFMAGLAPDGVDHAVGEFAFSGGLIFVTIGTNRPSSSLDQSWLGRGVGIVARDTSAEFQGPMGYLRFRGKGGDIVVATHAKLGGILFQQGVEGAVVAHLAAFLDRRMDRGGHQFRVAAAVGGVTAHAVQGREIRPQVGPGKLCIRRVVAHPANLAYLIAQQGHPVGCVGLVAGQAVLCCRGVTRRGQCGLDNQLVATPAKLRSILHQLRCPYTHVRVVTAQTACPTAFPFQSRVNGLVLRTNLGNIGMASAAELLATGPQPDSLSERGPVAALAAAVREGPVQVAATQHLLVFRSVGHVATTAVGRRCQLISMGFRQILEFVTGGADLREGARQQVRLRRSMGLVTGQAGVHDRKVGN